MSGINQGHRYALLFAVEFEDGNKLPAAHVSEEIALESARQAEAKWRWKAVRVTHGAKTVLEGQALRAALGRA